MCTKQFRVGRIIIKASRLLCDVKLRCFCKLRLSNCRLYAGHKINMNYGTCHINLNQLMLFCLV